MSRCLVCCGDVDGGDYHPRCVKTLFGVATPPALELDEADLQRLAGEVVNQRLAVPGVQRKLSLALHRERGAQRLTLVGVFGGTHILKPPTPDYPGLPEIEHLTMRLAAACGIKTAAHGLVRMRDGRLAYLTRRFDRVGRRKIAVEDLCQLAELPTSQKYRYSTERAGQLVRRFSSNPGDDVLAFFELVVFSFMTGNADMHLKNFSLLTHASGRIGVAPAYDLVSTRLLISERDDPEELALPVSGRKAKLKRADFERLGETIALPAVVVRRVLDSYAARQDELARTVARGFVQAATAQTFTELIAARIARLTAP